MELNLDGIVVLAGDAAPEDGAELQESILVTDRRDTVGPVDRHWLEFGVGGRERRRDWRNFEDGRRNGRWDELGRLWRRLGVAARINGCQAEESRWAPDASSLCGGGSELVVGRHFEMWIVCLWVLLVKELRSLRWGVCLRWGESELVDGIMGYGRVLCGASYTFLVPTPGYDSCHTRARAGAHVVGIMV